MQKATTTIKIDSGVEVEISTTQCVHENGKQMSLDAKDITLSDYFELEERIEKAMGVLLDKARTNTKRNLVDDNPAFSVDDDKANKSITPIKAEPTKED
ncbi:MAG TPA: hypothetical protein PLM93_11630 [Sulfuricurvum sp.]|nr:MAG: hypothetical protein B7X89_11165 [Sulfuricurvum sp. 17-40-25]HQS67825.1 hypothetical protein [Sulfuricurvum sp.]